MSDQPSLRDLLNSGRTIVIPGVFDALGATVFERAGFQAVYMSGYSVSAAQLGLPDVGLITLTEMAASLRNICSATSLPVLADADTGFGNAVNVTRTVRIYMEAGAAGLQLEDQVFPKRCGHVAGRQVISKAEAAGKIRAAVDTRDRLDPDFLIIARTDARGVAGGSIDAAVERGRAYAEAGADIVFLEGLMSSDEIDMAVKGIARPLIYNVSGVSPKLSIEELNDLGIAIALFPVLSLAASTVALWDIAHALIESGTTASDDIRTKMENRGLGSLHAFMRFSEMRAIEAAYLPREEADKYDGSLGFQP